MNILIVPPLSWRENDTAAVRGQLVGKPVQINAGCSVEYVPHNDLILVITGEEDGPHSLREIGDRSRECGIRLEYSCKEGVATRIISLLGKSAHG